MGSETEASSKNPGMSRCLHKFDYTPKEGQKSILAVLEALQKTTVFPKKMKKLENTRCPLISIACK